MVETVTVYLAEAAEEQVDATRQSRPVDQGHQAKVIPAEMHLAPFEAAVVAVVLGAQEETLQVALQVQQVLVRRPQYLAGLAQLAVRVELGPQHLLQLRER